MQPSKETMVYECAICHKLYYDKSKADYCCQDRTCSSCDTIIWKKRLLHNFVTDVEKPNKTKKGE